MSEKAPRGNPKAEKPYFWIARSAAERIKKEFGTQAAYGIVVYAALADLSAKAMCARLQVTIGKIARECGLGYRKTAMTLDDLEAKGLVAIEPGLRAKGSPTQAPNFYTLLSTKKAKQPARNAASSRHDVPPPVGTREQASRAEIPIELSVGESSEIISGLPAGTPAPLDAGGVPSLPTEKAKETPGTRKPHTGAFL